MEKKRGSPRPGYADQTHPKAPHYTANINPVGITRQSA
jgi:hypothetical protein